MALHQFLQILLARRWMIITAIIASLVGALVVVKLLPPRYEASTRVMIDIIKPDPVTGQVLANQFVRAYTSTQIELIKDYKVAGRVADELGWTSDPGLLEQFNVPGDQEATRRRMAKVIIDGTDAGLIEGSNILEIRYTGSSPDSAKAVADAIRRAYVDVSLSFKRDSAAQSADWYQVQTEKARRLLVIAEQSKSEYEREHGVIMQPDNTDVDSARLAALSQQGAAPAGGAVPMPVGPSPSSIELAKVDATLAQAQRTLGPNHPTLRMLQQQRAALASAAAQERAAASSASSAAASAANAAAGATRQALEAQKAKVMAKRDELTELRQLQDEVDLRRDQYQKAAARSAELRLQADVADAGLTLLGSAVAPEDPAFPNIPLITIGALAFGAALGILAALLTELLSRRIRGARDLADAALDVPLLAVIGPAQPPASGGWIGRVRSRLRMGGTDEALAA